MDGDDTETKELFGKLNRLGARTRISAEKNTPRNTVVFLALNGRYARFYFNASILSTLVVHTCTIKHMRKKKASDLFIYRRRVLSERNVSTKRLLVKINLPIQSRKENNYDLKERASFQNIYDFVIVVSTPLLSYARTRVHEYIHTYTYVHTYIYVVEKLLLLPCRDTQHIEYTLRTVMSRINKGGGGD